MKIIVDKLPEACRKCLFYAPGQIIRTNVSTNSYCRLSRYVVDREGKERPEHCPLTTSEIKK